MINVTSDILNKRCSLVFVRTSQESNVQEDSNRKLHDNIYYTFELDLRRIVNKFFLTHRASDDIVADDPSYLKALDTLIRDLDELSNKIVIYLNSKRQRGEFSNSKDREDDFVVLANLSSAIRDKVRSHIRLLRSSRTPRMMEIRNAIGRTIDNISKKFNSRALDKLLRDLLSHTVFQDANISEDQIRNIEFKIIQKHKEFVNRATPILKKIEEHVENVQTHKSLYKSIDKSFIEKSLDEVKDIFINTVIHDHEISDMISDFLSETSDNVNDMLADIQERIENEPLSAKEIRSPLMSFIKLTHFRRKAANTYFTKSLSTYEKAIDKSYSPRGPIRHYPADQKVSPSVGPFSLKDYIVNIRNDNGDFDWPTMAIRIKRRVASGEDSIQDLLEEYTARFSNSRHANLFKRWFNVYKNKLNDSPKQYILDIDRENIQPVLNKVRQTFGSISKDGDAGKFKLIYNTRMLHHFDNLIEDSISQDVVNVILESIKSYDNMSPGFVVGGGDTKTKQYYFGPNYFYIVCAIVKSDLYKDILNIHSNIYSASQLVSNFGNQEEKENASKSLNTLFGWFPITNQSYEDMQSYMVNRHNNEISAFLDNYNSEVQIGIENALAENILNLEDGLNSIKNAIDRIAEEKGFSEDKNIDSQRRELYNLLRSVMEGKTISPSIASYSPTPLYLLSDNLDIHKYAKMGFMSKMLFNFKFMSNLNVFKALSAQIEVRLIQTLKSKQADLGKIIKAFSNAVDTMDLPDTYKHSFSEVLQNINLSIQMAIQSLYNLSYKIKEAEEMSKKPEGFWEENIDQFKKFMKGFFGIDSKQNIRYYSDNNIIKIANTPSECSLALKQLGSFINSIDKFHNIAQEIYVQNKPQLDKFKYSKKNAYREAAFFVENNVIGNPAQDHFRLPPRNIFETLGTVQKILTYSYQHLELLCKGLVNPNTEVLSSVYKDIIKSVQKDEALMYLDQQNKNITTKDIDYELNKIYNLIPNPKLKEWIRDFRSSDEDFKIRNWNDFSNTLLDNLYTNVDPEDKVNIDKLKQVENIMHNLVL